MASRLDDLIREHAQWLDQLAGPIDLTEVTSAPRNDTTNVALIDIDTTWTPSEGRHRWPIIAVAAAAVVAVVVGGLMIARRTDDPTGEVPADQHSTVVPTTVAPTTVAPRTETGFLALHDGLSVTFTIPDGWGMPSPKYRLVHHSKHSGRDEAGVQFLDVGNVYADGCQWVLVDPPVGPTVDDLVSALANLPGLAPTAAVDITVDGYVGKQMEFTVPRYIADCKESRFALWQVEGDESGFPHAPDWNTHIQLWILDVGGTRLVIQAYSYVSTSPQDRAALDEVLASIQIG